MKAAPRSSLGGLALNGYGLIFILFLYAPLILILIYSFNSNPVNMAIWSGFTLDWYRSLFGFTTNLQSDVSYIESTDELIAAVKNSAIVALLASIISTAIGTAAAVALARGARKLKAFYNVLLMIPMIMPDIVLGIALLIFFASVGLKLGLATIVLGHCTFLSSYVFLVVSARLAGMDSSLEEASSDLGASYFTTFRRITLPLIMPGVVGGFLLAFIISLDDVVITYFIAGVDAETLPLFILGMMRRGIKPEINAMAMLLVIFSFLVAALGLWLRARKT